MPKETGIVLKSAICGPSCFGNIAERIRPRFIQLPGDLFDLQRAGKNLKKPQISMKIYGENSNLLKNEK